jgi:hypothetical protein
MRLRLLALGLLLAGCAGTPSAVHPVAPGALTAPGAPTAPAPVDFPVSAVPRPIVLIGSPWEPLETVGSEAEKVAVGNGRFTFTGGEPATPGLMSVELPDGPATLPLIGVRAAVDAVNAMAEDGPQGSPLELVSAELGTAAFRTDRGELELPAWRFRSSFGSVWAWPALTPEAFWRLGEVGFATHHAATFDGVELVVQLPDPGPPCPGEEPSASEAVVTEGAAFVTVGLRTTGGGTGTCARDAMYRSKPYTVKLKEPLGARLLVDENNGVIPVAVQ